MSCNLRMAISGVLLLAWALGSAEIALSTTWWVALLLWAALGVLDLPWGGDPRRRAVASAKTLDSTAGPVREALSRARRVHEGLWASVSGRNARLRPGRDTAAPR